MNSNKRFQYYEDEDDDDDIEYVGTVTPATTKFCNSEIKNGHTSLKRSLKDFPSVKVKKFSPNAKKNETNFDSGKINFNDLSQKSKDNIDYIGYSPPCTLSSIIILILMNTEHKSLTYFQLRDIICELFPHFEKEDLYKRMVHRIALATPTKKNNQNKGSQFFLKNFLDRQAQSTLVMLNPAEEINWKEYVLHEIVNDSKMKASMRKPELLPQLIQGLAKISIIYERETPIITIIPSWNVSKSTASNEMPSIYYSINKKKQEQSKALKNKQNKNRLGSKASSNYSMYDSEESLPDLSDNDTRKSSFKDSFKNKQKNTQPTVKTDQISQSTGLYSKISAKSSLSKNYEGSADLQYLELNQIENTDDEIPETINSNKDHLLKCNTLSEGNKLNICLDRSRNINKKFQRLGTILTNENTFNSLNEDNNFHGKKSLQEVSNCLTVWKNHFPWMQYMQEEQTFHCKTCNWLSCEESQSEVFKINLAQDVYDVAAKLRLHSREEFHIISAAKYEELVIQCKYQYIALKDHLIELSSEKEVINFVELTAERKLYTMQSIVSSDLSGMAITSRLLAEYIEDTLLSSLKKSSFFSVLALEEKGYTIVRWLDSSLDPVEHLFYSRLRFPDDNMSSLEFLERQQVDLSKLVSYSKYPSNKSDFYLPERMAHFERSASPFRIPTISMCLEWLNKFTFFHQIHLEVSFVCKISKSMPHKFIQISRGKILANIKDPESPEILLDQEVMNIFFDNIKVLKDIAQVIYTQTGSLEALGFHKSFFNYASIKNIIGILVDINKYLQDDNHELSAINKIRINLLDIEKYELNATPKEEKYQLFVKQEIKEEFHEVDKDVKSVIGILDMYLSYVALALSSPSEEIVEDYQRYSKCSQSEDVESVLYLLDTNSLERLSPSILEMRSLFNEHPGHAYTILDIIKKIKDQPLLQVKYPFGWKLMQAVAVLPFLPAKIEQNMFNVATGEYSLMNKDMTMMIPSLLYIMLEGPEAQDMDEEKILSYWSNSWKNVTQS